MVIYIYFKFHDIPFSGFLDMAPDGRTDGWTNMDKTISAGDHKSGMSEIMLF